MPFRARPGRHAELEPQLQSIAPPGDEEPFRILLIGDFSARSGMETLAALDRREPFEVDPANLPEIPDPACLRAVSFLLEHALTGPEIKLFLLDATFEELEQDLSKDDFRDTVLYRLCVPSAATRPYAVIGALYPLDANISTGMVLARGANVARKAGIPFLAAADGDIADWVRNTSPVREIALLPEAKHLALLLPKVKLQKDESGWSCPVVVALSLLAQAFVQAGWKMVPGQLKTLTGVKATEWELEGESLERAVLAGFMPIVNEASGYVRVPIFQSISLSALPGLWRNAT